MQSDLGKLFIGGISWDTNEERLKEYFNNYGQVLEAVIMKDHTTGRARGFGFIVFSDPIVAERVTKEKHNIDGRMVEAKKAVPRDDQSTVSRTSNSIQGSPNQSRTRKIFVGGLASTVTETDFRMYFQQFGTITDVVVMYDHGTQRPRGFGFITYDSEDAVDMVLLKTFHELNGKMVEVKRAVPKELSPGPTRSPLGGVYPYPLTQTSSFINGGYGVRMDGRFSPVPVPVPSGRTGPGYGLGLNLESGMNGSYTGGVNFNFNRTGPGYYNSNRFGNPMGFDGGNGGNSNTSFFSSNTRNVWGNGGFNYGSNSGSTGVIGGGIIGNNGVNWGSGNGSSGTLSYGNGDGNYGLRGVGYGRNGSNSVGVGSYGGSSVSYEGPFSEFYGGGGGSVYGADLTWRSVNSEREESGPFGGYGLGGGVGGGGADVQSKSSSGFVGGYGVAMMQENRGITG